MKRPALFVWPSAEWSTFDVARGLRAALDRQDVFDIRDYRLYNRLKYHAAAFKAVQNPLPEQVDAAAMSRAATETVLPEAMYHSAEVVIIISGAAFHPNGLWLLAKAGVPTVMLHTESPYEDQVQERLSELVSLTFTNDRWSARQHEGWVWLPHAYDPLVHRPTEPTQEPCDVLLLATGWKERQSFLEQVDWTGINLRLLGLWPTLTEESPLWRYYEQSLVDNDQAPGIYASAKINLNFHRAHPHAHSLNPRARELGACAAFQLSDPRPELFEVFADSVPTFTSPQELEWQIRHYLEHEDEREGLRQEQHRRVLEGSNTFDARAERLLHEMAVRLGPVPASTG